MNDSSRSGSALVIVMGMLAVLMLLAVSFSVFMRTERAGTTNTRHATVARSSMRSAIGAVMEAIDTSFGSPTNVLPVPPWRKGVLGSATSAPHYQSELLIEDRFSALSATDQTAFFQNRKNNAKLLNSAVNRHLTPGQYILASNTKTDWAPIVGGIRASMTTGRSNPGSPYNYQRPKDDQVVGRFAFVALNTTGLLDMNYACGGLGRSSDTAADSANFDMQGSAFATEIRGQDVFTVARSKTGNFFSYADMLKRVGVNTITPSGYQYPLDTSPQADRYIEKSELFTTFTTSLDESSPYGAMKIPLVLPPSPQPGVNAEKVAYATKAHKAFQKIFTEGGNVNHTFGSAFASTRLPQFTRAELATQALVDYLDEDDIPAGGVATGGTSPLDYPCTESVPMVQGVYAWFTCERTGRGTLNGQNYEEWKLDLNVLPVIANPSWAVLSPPDVAKKYKARIEINLEEVANQLGNLWPSGSILTPPPGWDLDANLGAGSVADAQANSANILTFTTSEHAITDQTWGIFQSGPVIPALVVKAFEKTPGVMDYRKFSELAESNAATDIRPTVKVKVSIINEAGATVQQVPSPALDNPAFRPQGKYWVQVNPGLYHAPGNRTGASSELETGWAMPVDPRFAYNTESMYFNSGYNIWLNNDQAHTVPGSSPLRPIYDKMILVEKGSDLYTSYPQGNALLYALMDPTVPATQINDFWRAMSNGMPIYPDSIRSFSASGNLFLSTDNFLAALKHGVMNSKMESAGELGTLLIGPMETLSLFNTFLPNGKRVQHRAVDFFTTSLPRAPTWSASPTPGAGAEVAPAVHAGRVSLNAPGNILSVWNESGRGVSVYGKIDGLNTEPLAVLFNQSSYVYDQSRQLSFPQAKALANAFCDSTWLPTPPGATIEMATRLSDIGNGAKANDPSSTAWDVTPMLEYMYNDNTIRANLKCDSDRESLIVNSVNGLTVRAQTFLVILRADAFAPNYGTDSLSDGTTLASTHAIVELWRDPDYIRDADGYNIGGNTYTHGWYVHSVRMIEE